MQKQSIAMSVLSVLAIVALLSGCAGWRPPSDSNFVTPEVTLNYVDVGHYFGWWYYAPDIKPTKGTAGSNAAPLDYAFIFDIHNPNSFPVMLEDFKFACMIDGFEINSGYSTESQWIPAGKTNQLRVEVMFDPQGTMMSLGVVAGNQLKEKGVGLWDELEKIWTGAPDFTFPVGVTQGAAVFKAGDVTKVAGFEGTYPK
ncbi:MAG: LEA type 2 family protein [Desulfobacterales bacterium]|nr:MAG: LEA type 2 family protein [Desulfobacterales bacterium]